MKTIVLDEPGRFSMTDTAPPERAKEGHALVRIHRVGICGTDLHAFRGRQPFFSYPRILGHELGVEVVEVGDNDHGIRVGDRCAVEPYLNCGECVACRRGKPNCCASLSVMGVHVDGGMRETISVPTHKLHKSDSLSLEQLALVETLGIGHHAVSRGAPEPGEWTLVVGAGPIGLGVIQFAQIDGARLIVADVNEDRLRFCREAFGVEHTLNPLEDFAERLADITDGDMPTLVFDATGNPASMAASFAYPASGGRLVFVGLVQADIAFNDPEFHRKELTLYATRNSCPEDFRRIVRLMEDGRVDTDPWITHRADADEMIEAFPTWLDPASGTIKAMVAFGE